MKIFYRARQFWLDITPKPLSDSALVEIQAHLTAAEYDLFKEYEKSDQQHAYQVMRQLKQNEYINEELLTAALLHDVGKSRFKLSVWDRVWPVLVKKMAPNLYRRWGAAAPTGWKRPFVVINQHPAWGAEMARAVGSHPVVVSLIQRHQETLSSIKTEEDQLLSLLQWSDNQN